MAFENKHAAQFNTCFGEKVNKFVVFILMYCQCVLTIKNELMSFEIFDNQDQVFFDTYITYASPQRVLD